MITEDEIKMIAEKVYQIVIKKLIDHYRYDSYIRATVAKKFDRMTSP